MTWTRCPNALRWTGLALSALLGWSAPAQVQPSQGFSSIPVSLDPENRQSFWIDANATVTFTLQARRRDLRLVFRDPRGLAWEIVAPASEPGQVPPETLYGITIEGPAAGAWTLSVTSSTPLRDRPAATLRIAYANRVHARLALPGRAFVSGATVPVSLELMDGGARVKDLRITAALARPEDPMAPPIPVTFRDDGSQGDRIARDGSYTAIVPAEAPGRFRLEAQIEGVASTGRCHRTIDSTFRVAPKAARITGNLRQGILAGRPD